MAMRVSGKRERGHSAMAASTISARLSVSLIQNQPLISIKASCTPSDTEAVSTSEENDSTRSFTGSSISPG